MKKVKCILGRPIFDVPEAGKQYWIDETSIYKDSDGTEYVEVYTNENKEKLIGRFRTDHFDI